MLKKYFIRGAQPWCNTWWGGIWTHNTTLKETMSSMLAIGLHVVLNFQAWTQDAISVKKISSTHQTSTSSSTSPAKIHCTKPWAGMFSSSSQDFGIPQGLRHFVQAISLVHYSNTFLFALGETPPKNMAMFTPPFWRFHRYSFISPHPQTYSNRPHQHSKVATWWREAWCYTIPYYAPPATKGWKAGTFGLASLSIMGFLMFLNWRRANWCQRLG